MPKYLLNLLLVFAFGVGYAALTVALTNLFGWWALAGCGAVLLIPILFLDIEEDSENG